MQYIRAIKDKSARHIMLGIAIFALLFLASYWYRPVFKGITDY